MKINNFRDNELARFKHFQRQSFSTVISVAKTLRAGMTEHDAARALRKAFHEQGVHHYFHVPVALFGDRTGYPDDFGEYDALPTDRILEEGMAVILDAAPIYEGYLVDTSLPFSFGDKRQVEAHVRLLEPFRAYMLEQVRAGASFRAIEHGVDEMIHDLGAENAHRKHIGAVLGHRVMKAGNMPWDRLSYKMLGVQQVGWFFAKSHAVRKGWMSHSPNWNKYCPADQRPLPGLWAAEPHFFLDGIGVKFEEILVITDSDAFWLDDDLPHTALWAGARSNLDWVA